LSILAQLFSARQRIVAKLTTKKEIFAFFSLHVILYVPNRLYDRPLIPRISCIVTSIMGTSPHTPS
ncbi:hypothetical protein, partial [Bacillus cereus]|uniref:hypothetical protein n=1 Tax=Bacillus cereus TaxID=1396 RepID=UPI001AD8B104